MRLLHEIAIFQTVKSKVIMSLFETVRLSVSISLRNLYNSLNSIKEIAIISSPHTDTKRTRVDKRVFWPQYFRKIEYVCLISFILT